MIPFARSQFGTILIETIRCLKDNYVYLIGREGSPRRVVIDPGEAGPVRDFLTEQNLELELILNTHHHHDHIGGNAELQAEFAVPAYASAHDLMRIPGLARGLRQGDRVTAAGVEFEILEIPGHTLGQLAYFVREQPSVFVGDTLFSMGCGRLFEGTPAMMRDSLERLLALPEETHLFVGHEYTERNGAFARTVESSNLSVMRRLHQLAEKFRDLPTAAQIMPPVTLREEAEVNPFLRVDSDEIAAEAKIHGIASPARDLAVFTRLREMRNTF